MVIVISPAKTLDFETPPVIKDHSLPELLHKSEKLMGRLKKMSPAKLSELMDISKDLAGQNYMRFQQWQLPFTPENSKQAVLAFNGDVYRGLEAKTLPPDILKYAQQRLRILSGLYGVLRPLDLIQPYRLEMGTVLKYQRSENLYQFWNPEIREKIHEALKQSGNDVLVNLASAEYFKSIDVKILKVKVVTPEFRELKNDKYKIISLFAKKARGRMTRFILENRIEDPEQLKAFDLDGYHFNPDLSAPGNPVFTREQQ